MLSSTMCRLWGVPRDSSLGRKSASLSLQLNTERQDGRSLKLTR